MILDYNAAQDLYVYRGPATADVTKAAVNAGFEYSLPASRANSTVFFSKSPFCALNFWDVATVRARQQLAPIYERYTASWAKEWTGTRLTLPDDVELRPFQSAGVDYLLREANGLSGDQPGLGKTMQAIVAANEMRARRILIVCPAAVRSQWVRQIGVWGTGDTRVYVIEKASHGVSPLARWTVVSYDLLRGVLLPSLLIGGWDMVVLDEAHYLKTPTAERTRAAFGGTSYEMGEDDKLHRRELKGVTHSAAKVIALSGTPLPNRPNEAYTLARALDWGSIDYMSHEAFKSRFNPNGIGWETTKHLDELHARLRASFMVRRMKRDVLTQLPQVQFELVAVDGDGAVRAAVKRETMLDLKVVDGAVDANFDGAISTVRREMGVAMAPHVSAYVVNLLEGGVDKLVLFGWHKEVLDMWQTDLEKKDYQTVRIDGTTSMLARDVARTTFISDPKCRVILGNLMALGVGVDGLQEVCSTAVLGEQSWVPGDNEQAIDRLNRMGQTEGVRAIFLTAEGSISEKIVRDMVRKANTVHETLDKKR